MSDYLWDKTGEADDEARRLEELLGGLKFQPRPLELPALPARHLVAARARTPLSWPRLAIAASLAAALLLGAWLLIAGRRTTSHEAGQLAGTTDAPGGEKDKYQPGATLKAGDDKTPKAGNDEQPKVIDNADETPREANTAKGPKPRRPDLAGDKRKGPPRANGLEVARLKTPSGVPIPREAVAWAVNGVSRGTRHYDPTRSGNPQLNMGNRIATRFKLKRRELIARKFTDEEIAAAEKVMFALRLTSEKLAYARQQVQDAGRREPNR